MPSYLQYNTSALLYECFIKERRNNFQGISKFGVGAVQLFFCLHVLARLVRCGCSCINFSKHLNFISIDQAKDVVEVAMTQSFSA